MAKKPLKKKLWLKLLIQENRIESCDGGYMSENKSQIKKVLKAPVPQELKGKLLDELRNS